MSDNSSLPAGFADLEPFVAEWAVSTMAERLSRRVNSTPESRLKFYRTVGPRTDAALMYLNDFPLEDIPKDPQKHRLLQLTLSMVEVSLTEEVNGQAVEAEHARSNRLINMVKELDGL
jgi:hypothetical protein